MAVDDFGVKRRGRFGRFMVILLVAVLVIAAAWTWFALSWSYSEGERAGILQKFSKKGWICTTYEGELALNVVGGVAPQPWDSLTRDEKVAQQLSAEVGNHVRIHYTEHRGVPTSCFAETPYFVESLTKVDR